MTWASIVSAATVIIPAVLAFLASRIGKAGEREGALIVRLQNEIKRRDVKDQERDAKIEKLIKQVNYLLRRDGLWDVHATRLEGQITDLGGVPIPRPAALAAQIEED